MTVIRKFSNLIVYFFTRLFIFLGCYFDNFRPRGLGKFVVIHDTYLVIFGFHGLSIGELTYFYVILDKISKAMEL